MYCIVQDCKWGLGIGHVSAQVKNNGYVSVLEISSHPRWPKGLPGNQFLVKLTGCLKNKQQTNQWKFYKKMPGKKI